MARGNSESGGPGPRPSPRLWLPPVLRVRRAGRAQTMEHGVVLWATGSGWSPSRAAPLRTLVPAPSCRGRRAPGRALRALLAEQSGQRVLLRVLLRARGRGKGRGVDWQLPAPRRARGLTGP